MANITYSLSIRRIQYVDENIGNDFQFNINCKQGSATFNTSVPHGTTREYQRKKYILRNIEHKSGNLIDLDLTTVGIERDTSEAYDDKGKSKDHFKVPAIRGIYVFKVSVAIFGDRKGDWNKRYNRAKRGQVWLHFEMEVKVKHDKLTPGERLPIPERIIPGTTRDREPVLAFMSDLHVGDGTAVDDFDDFDDDCFIQALDWLEQIGQNLKRPVYLTLLGDFLELWEADAKFTTTGRDDNGNPIQEERMDYLPNDPIELKVEIAKAKVDRVVNAHRKIMTRLARWSQSSNHRLYMVIGNHDDDFVSALVEKHFLAKSFRGNKIKLFNSMRMVQAFPVYHVWAEHGHNFDPFNLASQFGAKPNGRLVVEELSRIIELLETFGGFHPYDRGPRVRNPFNHFDSVRTYKNLIKCLKSKKYFDDDSPVIQRMSDIVNSIMGQANIDPIPGDPQVARRIINCLAKSYIDTIDFLGQWSPLERIEYILGKIQDGRKSDPPSKEDARTRLSAEVQCVVMGHNHKPEMRPLGTDERYVNTGNWQDIGTTDPDAPDCFKLAKHRNLFLIYRDPEQFRGHDGTPNDRTVRVDHFRFPNAEHFDKMFYQLRG